MDTIAHTFQSVETPAVLLTLALMLLLSRSPRFKGPVILLSMLISSRYMLWRGFFTLNPADYLAIAISSTLLGAELYGFLQNILFYYQSSKPTDRRPPADAAGYLPAVDIFVTIYNEPKDILLRTLVGCQAQDYPKDKFNIYVLDDGDRAEIRELAARLGTRYIARGTNRDAKAGNLNNAIGLSDGWLIAIFDCDHVPVRSFLRETVGFFIDPKVAIVQVPHHFYNPDTFQRNLRLEREIANEQDLFFHIIQPGRDHYNSAFFAGSCGVFRRSALAEVGGIITKTITEDLHTSMVLHAKGYRSVYLNKDLSAGLAPESCAGYMKQRQRWAKGGAQVFILDNPLLKRGLGFHQRLHYLASVLYFFHGLPRIIYIAAPLSYLFFKYPPLVADVSTLLGYFLPHYAATLIAFNMVSKGHRNPFWSDVYETLMSFVLTLAVFKTVLKPRGHTFAVTPKGERHERFRFEARAIAPHTAMTAFLLLGAAAGLGDFLANGGDRGALAVSLSWASYNILILLAAIMAAGERPQKRGHIRLERRIRCELILPQGRVPCVTRDLSATGVSLRLDGPVAFTEPVVRLDLISDYGEVTHLKGCVVRNDREKDGAICAAVSFLDMDEGLEHSIIRQMFSPEGSWDGHHEKEASIRSWSVFHIFTVISGFFKGGRSLRRVSPRFPLAHGCEVVLNDVVVAGTTGDISLTGLSVEIAEKAGVPGEVVIRVDGEGGKKISAKGEVAWKFRKKNGAVVIGVRFSDPVEGKALWEAVISS